MEEDKDPNEGKDPQNPAEQKPNGDTPPAGDPPADPANPAPSGEKTTAELLAEAQAESARLEDEAENYRKAENKAKRKNRGDDPDDPDSDPEEKESVEEVVERSMKRREAESKAAAAKQRERDLQNTLIRENAELKTALANKAPAPASAGGKGTDKPAPSGEHYWTPEQEAEIRKRGLDPEKVKNNLPNGMQMPVIEENHPQ